jgi:hypothetical protein
MMLGMVGIWIDMVMIWTDMVLVVEATVQELAAMVMVDLAGVEAEEVVLLIVVVVMVVVEEVPATVEALEIDQVLMIGPMPSTIDTRKQNSYCWADHLVNVLFVDVFVLDRLLEIHLAESECASAC